MGHFLMCCICLYLYAPLGFGHSFQFAQEAGYPKRVTYSRLGYNQNLIDSLLLCISILALLPLSEFRGIFRCDTMGMFRTTKQTSKMRN